MALDDTLNQAKLYTRQRVQEHVQKDDPHPQYVQMVYPDGDPTGGAIIALRPSDTALPPVQEGSVVFAPGPTPARGVYMPNETNTAWVRLGEGPIPVDTTPPTVPGNFRITARTTTSITVAWNASTDDESGLNGYEVSLDGGTYTPVGNTLTHTFGGLAASTTPPSHTMRVRAVDNASTPNRSNPATVTGAAQAVVILDTDPSNLRATARATTSLTWTWDAPPDNPSGATLTRYEFRQAQGNTVGGTFASNGTSTSRPVTGLTQNTTYTAGVRAVFSNGAVSDEITATATTTSSTPSPTVLTVPGLSNQNTSSTIDNMGWKARRTYTSSALNRVAGFASVQNNGMICHSPQGPFLTGSVASVQSQFRAVLDGFYYGGSSTSTTMTASRANISLYLSNGNEIHNPTKIPNGSIQAFVDSMQGCWQAVHYVDPATGQRRYPKAYAGSNPTMYYEGLDQVQRTLHPSAQWHDFVVWSMYPPDMGNNGENIVYDWPSFSESQRLQKPGFLLRCFYRTKAAEALARQVRGGSFRMQIAGGEVGVGIGPTSYDPTLRPYWAVHSIFNGCVQLSKQYDLDCPFVCWWDQPYPDRDTDLNTDATRTTPNTATAWFNARQYNHLDGGTHPSSWAGNPKSSWNTLGPVV